MTKIEMLTGQGTTPKVALAQVMEEIGDDDAIFVVVCKPNAEHDVWVRSSRFASHQLLLAAQYLQAEANQHILSKVEP